MQSDPTDEQDQQSGSALVNELINSHEAFLTNHMGSSAPTYRDAGTIWIDNSANPWQVYMYDGTDDVLLFTFNTSTNTVNYEMNELTTSGGGSGDAVIRDAFNSVDLVQFNEGGPIDFLDNAAVNFLDVVTLEDTVNIEGRLNVENDLAPVALINRTGSTNDAELEIQDGDGSKHSLVRRANENRLDITNNADTNLLEIDDGGDVNVTLGSLTVSGGGLVVSGGTLDIQNNGLTVSGGNLDVSSNNITNIGQAEFNDESGDSQTFKVSENSTSGNLEVDHENFSSPIIINEDGRIENVTNPSNAQDVATKDYVDQTGATSGAYNSEEVTQTISADSTETVSCSEVNGYVEGNVSVVDKDVERAGVEVDDVGVAGTTTNNNGNLNGIDVQNITTGGRDVTVRFSGIVE